MEMAWLKKEESRCKVLIAVHFESGLSGTNLEIDQLGKELLEDINKKFLL